MVKMEGDTRGVRIIPRCIEFADVAANTTHKINVVVQNISRNRRRINVLPPQSKNFTLRVKNSDHAVASGLEVQGVLEYCVSEPVEEADRLLVIVDGEPVEVPILAGPSKPILELQREISFGDVVAKSKVICKELPLFNHGSKTGDFRIKYSGSKPISIVPNSGSVPPKSVQLLRVEYVTMQPQKFDEVAKVKLEGKDTSSLRITGNVVEGFLDLLSYGTQQPIRCVEFGCTQYGTDCTESALLYNNSPESVCFVAVLDEDVAGQELGNGANGDDEADRGGRVNDLTSLVTAFPSQGMLRPYEKIAIFFRFSPRWRPSKQGFLTTQEPPPRKDLSVCMQMKTIGASGGFSSGGQNKSAVLEVALTGSALPVLLSVCLGTDSTHPENTEHDFGRCLVGERREATCTVRNKCAVLPVDFQFRRVAHFSAKPAAGKIQRQETHKGTLSFVPNQIGTFESVQYLDVLGPVADSQNPFHLQQRVIYSVPLALTATADPVTTKKQPVFKPGITPKITNEVGLCADTEVSKYMDVPRQALHNAQFTHLHRIKSNKTEPGAKEKVLLSFPNDRAASLRPSNRHEKYQSVFTRTDRYTFVDPDYAYTDEEIDAIEQHKAHYVDFINNLRKQREAKQSNKRHAFGHNSVDIGIQPAAGLRPKKLHSKEAFAGDTENAPNSHFTLVSERDLAKLERMSSKRVRDGLNAQPTTPKEKADCNKILSPQELHRVVVGPPLVDFGKICLRSVSRREVGIVNNLDIYIHVNVRVDCKELRQTSPLSQVVPPGSKAVLPLVFESSTKGKFQRSLEYTINGFYRSHITVLSEVVPVQLQISPRQVELDPTAGIGVVATAPADAGVRTVVTLTNPLNAPAEFTWNPLLDDRGTAFSIRPATGFVDPYSPLDCEVVFHPSYMAPDDGIFALQVHGGNTLQLKCSAKFGPANVAFVDRRISFGQVPLHLTTTRLATLKNHGQHHAYFQVLDPQPFAGLTVSPLHGVVPVGGSTELRVDFTPDAVMKFDTRVQVAVRGAKTLELRMGGAVEAPSVDIDVKSFGFGGVHCGSIATLPFKLSNKSNTRARMEFDLSRYRDFELKFAAGSQTSADYSFALMNPGVHTVTLEPSQSADGELLFKPQEVAGYDFVMPVIINQTRAPTPAPSPFPPSPAPTSKPGRRGASSRRTVTPPQHIINPRPVHVDIVTPRRKVVATALRQPLQMSHQHLDFTLSPAVHQLIVGSFGYGHTKGTLLVNNSLESLRWALNLRECDPVLESGTFKLLQPSGMPFFGGVDGVLEPGETTTINVQFCPSAPGRYECSVPVVVNEDYEKPCCALRLSGQLQAERVWFNPPGVVLTPVPLDVEVAQQVQILVSCYTRNSTLRAETLTVECEDGSSVTPLTVTFPEGNEIPRRRVEDGQPDPFIMPCRIAFKCSRPVSFSENIRFTDDLENSYTLPVTATADNCLLTCYPFIAQHRTDHQIVVERTDQPPVQTEEMSAGPTSAAPAAPRDTATMFPGEAVLRPCTFPAPPGSRPSTTPTSSSFEESSPLYETDDDISGSFEPTPRDGALNKMPSDSDPSSSSSGMRPNEDASGASGSSALSLPEEGEDGDGEVESGASEVAEFHAEVLLTAQRWFSAHGWPSGPNPISIPSSLRSALTKKPRGVSTRDARGRVVEVGSGAARQDVRTLYDAVAHLSGRPLPGVSLNSPLPADPLDRVKQIHVQHTTLLAFIKTQGGCVSSIKSEYLMEPLDYKVWTEHERAQENENKSGGHAGSRVQTEEEEAVEMQLFEAVSKRAWTDVCLQLLKTLVLSKITPRNLKNLPSPYDDGSPPNVDPNPVCSNVYSIGERILLIWMNYHYQRQRNVIWKNSATGPPPAARWVVNFDFDLLDGLVLASLIGAHVPFTSESILSSMYTHPSTAEQCLHNALKVTSALKQIGLEYDIQAIDITDPNPIALLLLVTHLYMNLPQYIPKSRLDFTGALHATVSRAVKLSNPSSRPLTYTALLAGRDASDFVLPKGSTITLPPKSSQQVAVEFCSRFLRPAEAVLALVGRRQGASVGSTLVFTLSAQVDNVSPKGSTMRVKALAHQDKSFTLKVRNPWRVGADFAVLLVNYPQHVQNGCMMLQHLVKAPVEHTSACYELQCIPLKIENPFPKGGVFHIRLFESRDALQPDLTPAAAVASEQPQMTKRTPRKVRSRIDRGQDKCEDNEASTREAQKTEDSDLTAFSTNTKMLHLESNQTATLEVQFLPFREGRRQCSVVFTNPEIGEFVHSIDATVTLPTPQQQSQRGFSATPSGESKRDSGVVYWKCESGQTLKRVLHIPLLNSKREEALAAAARKRMSDEELMRRDKAGTLRSETILANAKRSLARETDEPATVGSSQQKSGNSPGQTFSVDVDSDLFVAPPTLFIPNPVQRTHSAPSGSKAGAQGGEETVELPVEFRAEEPGRHTCDVVLRSQDDVRVVRVECTVVPAGKQAEIEFTSPVHQPLDQNVPVLNQTDHDWPMEARVEGVGFSGPDSLIGKARQTCFYPLQFKPQFEGLAKGKLVLTNTAHGIDHIFNLRGIGEKPLALEHIVLQAQAKQIITRELDVPNVTRKKIYYKVESDLDFITGEENIVVLPGKTVRYAMSAKPLRRGHFKGVISFVAAPNPNKAVDSDGDELPEVEETHDTPNYRVWFSLLLNVAPPPSVGSMSLSCACQKKSMLEVGLNNPLASPLTLEVEITPPDVGLTGAGAVTLPAEGRGVYELQFAPAVIGHRKASVIFFHPSVGEFWYELNLTAGPPTPTALPVMQCELGRWVQQTITLNNPTDQTLTLVPTVSNCNNFLLERDSERPLELSAHTALRVPLTFLPSALGPGPHRATVSFHCEQETLVFFFTPENHGLAMPLQLGEWIYTVSGVGLLPQPEDPVRLSATPGSHSTVIVPFRNPLDETALCDITLTDKESGEVLNNPEADTFCLLLKHQESVRLGPKTTLDVPVCYAPGEDSAGRETSVLHESILTFTLRKLDEAPWTHSASPENDAVGRVPALIWTYPLIGCREADEAPPVPVQIACRARERTEQRLEVTLSAAAAAAASREETSAEQQPRRPEGVVVGDMTLAEEFSHELVFGDAEAQQQLEPAVALQLERKLRDESSGGVTLVFNVVFAPSSVMTHDVQLLVRGAAGGLWRFPLRFAASEPEVDDEVIVEAAGLGRDASVGFRLSSQTRHPVPFSAYFAAGSDRELSVTPARGELLPAGTLICVTFTPTNYGRVHQGKLIVQTADTQWTYNIKGVPPDYQPPQSQSRLGSLRSSAAGGRSLLPGGSGARPNYIRENMRLTTTAVSSPIKGAPLMIRRLPTGMSH